MTALRNALETDVPQLVPVVLTTALYHSEGILPVALELWLIPLGVVISVVVVEVMAVVISAIETVTATVTFEITAKDLHSAETWIATGLAVDMTVIAILTHGTTV